MNAVAIALAVTAFVGPEINPALDGLSAWERLRFLGVAVAFHLFAHYIARGMEDRS